MYQRINLIVGHRNALYIKVVGCYERTVSFHGKESGVDKRITGNRGIADSSYET